MKHRGRRFRSARTLAAQAGVGTDRSYGAVSAPIYLSAMYHYEAFGKHRGFDYSRAANPTRSALEEVLAELEQGTRAVAFASGMAAVSAALGLFGPGDRILCSDDLYGGNYRLFEQVLRPLGLVFDYIDMGDCARIEAAVRAGTKALFIETPTNPLMKIADLRGAAKVAKRHGLLTLVDNTFMSPALQRPISLGADLVIQSATKFLGGHNDLIGGAVIAADAKLGERLLFIQKAVGAVPGAFDCWLLLRGIKTLHVRVERAQDTAGMLAEFLAEHALVSRVFYPGLQGHPRRELHLAQADGPGSIISFELRNAAAVPTFLGALRTILLAESLGGVESLITHPSSMTHADIPAKEQAAVGLTSRLVRLSVGIEDAHDLRRDLEQALRATSRSRGRKNA
ncbi:MAG: cystathionine gamma-synthase [Betaproteobacteria bacterium RIFCSPLOWO2_12_FULL_63_13]|nr:MAG: cystathionine gamma-synthase [Betaproteobacteria bacterium RIFCSPLOWO2_02_FULL_63_19]OGA48140.1 MAG: cystathionine gamma-synthase [Betaproteobacteria bacterium RIFCSPLOWO2_12_FULL_63_13]